MALLARVVDLFQTFILKMCFPAIFIHFSSRANQFSEANREFLCSSSPTQPSYPAVLRYHQPFLSSFIHHSFLLLPLTERPVGGAVMLFLSGVVDASGLSQDL